MVVVTTMAASCKNGKIMEQKEQWISEIREAEAAFARLAAEKGVKEAFLAFAAADAVIVRGQSVHRGREALAAYFDAQTLRDVSLSWQPEFIDVSASGDMAYTYGPYKFRALSEAGDTVTAEGIFHTVWKRQPDGAWKFVYD